MHDLIEMNMEMAKRLKALRTSYEGHGLSHEKLRQAIEGEYHVDISKSSLLNYEAYGNHSKAKSNAGMKVEYLRIFADFYGVSADYILGIRDEATTDVGAQAACEYTGLSEESVSKLHKHANELKEDGIERNDELCVALDHLIQSESFREAIINLFDAVLLTACLSKISTDKEKTVSYKIVDAKALAQFKYELFMRETFEECVDYFSEIENSIFTEQSIDDQCDVYRENQNLIDSEIKKQIAERKESEK